MANTKTDERDQDAIHRAPGCGNDERKEYKSGGAPDNRSNASVFFYVFGKIGKQYWNQ